MATIVQPYNDWREKALVGFLGPIVGNWIQRSQEAEMNRKQNAMAAEALRQLGLGGNDYPIQNPSLAAGNVGSNNWENAFRSGSDNPLALFDANTATIAPNATHVSPAAPQSMPTLADIQATLINLGGTKRFGMVNPEAVQKLITPYLNAYEANRVEQRKSKLVDTIMAAKDAEERLNNALWPGYIMGDVDINGLNAGQAQYQYDNPYAVPQMYNAGGSTYGYSFNPRTGEFNFDGGVQFNNSLSPQDAANNAFRDKQLDTQNAQYYAGLESNERIANANRDFQIRQQKFLEEEARWKREHPELEKVVGQDGKLWGRNPITNELTPAIGSDGQQIVVDPYTYNPSSRNSSNSFSPYYNKADQDFITTRRKLIEQEQINLRTLEKLRTEAPTQELRDYYQTEIQKAKDNIAAYQKELKERENLVSQHTTANSRSKGVTSAPNNTAIYYHPDLKRTITVDDYEEMKRQAAAGTLLDPSTKRNVAFDEIDEWLQNDGWIKSDYPSTTQNNSTVSSDVAPQNNSTVSNDVNLTPILNEQEKERAVLQGDTGKQIANDSNSEIMWENPDGRTITKSQYENVITRSHVDEEKYNHFLETQGYRRADNSYNQAPPITDVVNGSTPTAMQNQVAYLNGNNNAPEFTGTTFMDEFLPGIQPHRDFTASLTPMGMSNGNESMTSLLPFTENQNPNSHMVYDPYAPSSENSNRQSIYPRYDDNNGWPPDDYSPYDINYPQSQPYSEDDQYERGFEFDDDYAPEVSGTTFMNQYLPGLENPGELAASKTPMGRGRRKSSLRRSITTRRNVQPQRTARKPGQIRPNTSYEQLRNEVDSSARRHGVDPELVRAIIQIESRWDSNAISTAGARGLMQLMPKTAQWLGVRDSYNPAQNIEGGTKYIAQLIRQYKGDISKALMAYNCGPGNVNKGRIPASTKQYARNVMAIYNRLKSRNN